jgi:hypothetical protein
MSRKSRNSAVVTLGLHVALFMVAIIARFPRMSILVAYCRATGVICRNASGVMIGQAVKSVIVSKSSSPVTRYTANSRHGSSHDNKAHAEIFWMFWACIQAEIST